METFLIADSGSTKTQWLLSTGKGLVLKEWSTSGLNPFFQNPSDIFKILSEGVLPGVKEALNRKTGDADWTFPQLSVNFYGAGCVGPEASEPIRSALAELFPGARLEIESDMLGAARSLCQYEPGTCCILGTGSNNCFYDGEKIVNNIPSLGFWLGDEGSGGHMGRTLVVAFLHDELPDSLKNSFSQRYPEVNRLEVLERAYRQSFPNRYFAGFMPFLVEFRDDKYIRSLINNSLGIFLEKYVQRQPSVKEYTVSFTGSVAWYLKEILMELMHERGLRTGLITQSPGARLVNFHAHRRY